MSFFLRDHGVEGKGRDVIVKKLSSQRSDSQVIVLVSASFLSAYFIIDDVLVDLNAIHELLQLSVIDAIVRKRVRKVLLKDHGLVGV